MRVTFKLLVIFKLYSLTLFNICVVGWIILAEIASRMAICELRRAENLQSDIIKTTGGAKTTVFQSVTNFDATGKTQRCRHGPQNEEKLFRHAQRGR